MSTTADGTTTRPLDAGRYTATAQALHWVTALLMFAVVILAWVMTNMARTDSWRDSLYGLHKSIGLTILALVAFRLAWRASYPPPRLPGAVAGWERRAAAASHVMLYVILLGMPLSGYVMSAAGRHPISYFGIFDVPTFGPDKAVSSVAAWLHVVTGQWLVYALVVLHLAATVWHVAVRRDGVLERMLPEPAE